MMKSAITNIHDNFDRRVEEYSLENANGTRIAANSLTASLDDYSLLKGTGRLRLLTSGILSPDSIKQQAASEVTVHENSLTFSFFKKELDNHQHQTEVTYSLFEDDSLSASYSDGQSIPAALSFDASNWSLLRLYAQDYLPLGRSQQWLDHDLRTSYEQRALVWPKNGQFFDWRTFFAQPEQTAVLFSLAAQAIRSQALMVFSDTKTSLRWEIDSDAQLLLVQKESFEKQSFLTFKFMSRFSLNQAANQSDQDIRVNHKIIT